MKLLENAAMAILLNGAPLAAQAPRPFPVIAGNSAIYVLVEPDGSVKTWGRSADSLSLGNGPAAPQQKLDEPAPLASARSAVGAAVGDSHALILLADGSEMAWGRNSECEVGNGDPSRKLRDWERLKTACAPAPVAGLHGVRQVAAGDRISGAVLEGGPVRVWGTGNEGLPADGHCWPRGMGAPCAPLPQPVEGLANVQQLSLGVSHSLALRRDGTVYAWGRNKEAQIGDGTREPRLRPVRVPGVTNAVEVAATHTRSLAVLSDGSVLAWGPIDTQTMEGRKSRSPVPIAVFRANVKGDGQ